TRSYGDWSSDVCSSDLSICQSGQAKTNPDGSPLWLIEPGEKRGRADRIGEHMSYQLLEEMPEWEPEFDAMLMQIPVVGGAAKKKIGRASCRERGERAVR